MQRLGKRLNWNDLADAYDRVHTITQRSARTLQMNTILEWAEKQTDKFEVTEDGYIYRKEVTK